MSEKQSERWYIIKVPDNIVQNIVMAHDRPDAFIGTDKSEVMAFSQKEFDLLKPAPTWPEG